MAKYALDLAIVGAAYFALANISLTLASIHSNVIPIWLPAGLALGAVLLRGLRVWPAIFAAAFAAGVPTDIAPASAADSLWPSLATAAGSTLAAVVGGYLINLWSHGRKTFDTPAGIAKFALVSVGPSALIGASVGVGGLGLAGYVEWANSHRLWLTWWLRDAAGTVVVAPLVVLWAVDDFRAFNPRKALEFRQRVARGGRRGRPRLQSAVRADRWKERARVSRGPAAAVGRATLRPARRRHRRVHSLVFCGLGRLGRRRAVRGGHRRCSPSCR